MEADKIKLNTVILAVLIVGSIEIVSRFLIGRGLLAPLAGVGLARLFAIVLLLILIRKGEKRLSAIGLQVAGTFQGFKKGLIWAISFGAAAGLALVVLYFFDVGTQGLFQMPLPQAGSKLILFFVVGAVIGPLAEEIFFRGILYGFLRRWGVFFAVAMSTLLFVLPHSYGHLIPITQVIGGILFAIAYEIEKNLLVPITIHVLGNLAIFTIALLF
jgi:membrane protease YdiL (CAAX protease family)